MRTAGIICECNPPHAGHARLIAEAKRSCDCVLCLLSGPFVQRGDAAVLSPRARAEILLGMGADVVLELPFPHAASSAETFAAAGVSILSRLGADDLWFGSETADLDLLSRVAAVADSPAFRDRYAARVTSDPDGTASLWFSTLSELCGLASPLSPNDLLAVSYLRALTAQKSAMLPRVIRREGSDYADNRLPADGIPSASALRKAVFDGNLQGVCSFLPDFEQKIIRSEADAGRFPLSLDRAAPAILSHLRLCDPASFDGIAELSGGLGRRLQKASWEAVDLPSLLSLASTKKYPLSRLRRGLLFALLGVTRSDLFAPPAYVRLLALNATGSAFLSSTRRSSGIPVVTSNAGVPSDPASQRQDELSRRARSLWSLCFPAPVPPADLLRENPIVIE